jgi:HPt (histidine-containing phosphotransfer) domain-containing protein
MKPDFSYLYQTADHQPRFVLELLTAMHENLAQLPRQLNLAHRQGQWSRMSELAHKLRSSVAFTGLEELTGAIIGINEMQTQPLLPGQLAALLQIVNDQTPGLQTAVEQEMARVKRQLAPQ